MSVHGRHSHLLNVTGMERVSRRNLVTKKCGTEQHGYYEKSFDSDAAGETGCNLKGKHFVAARKVPACKRMKKTGPMLTGGVRFFQKRDIDIAIHRPESNEGYE